MNFRQNNRYIFIHKIYKNIVNQFKYKDKYIAQIVGLKNLANNHI